jgi:hypothetical protein
MLSCSLLLCESQTLDVVTAYRMILEHPDPDEGFARNMEQCIEPYTGRCAHVHSLSHASNGESCNSYFSLTHTLCGSAEWVGLASSCGGGYILTSLVHTTVPEDRCRRGS